MPAENPIQVQEQLRERIARVPILPLLLQIEQTELAGIQALIKTTSQRFTKATENPGTSDVTREEALSVPQTLEAIYNDVRVSDASLEVALVLLEQRYALLGEGNFRDLTQELAEDASLAEQHKAIEDTLAPLFEAAKQPYKGHAEVNPEIDEVVKNLRMTFKKEEDAYPPTLDEVLSKAQADIAFASAEALEALQAKNDSFIEEPVVAALVAPAIIEEETHMSELSLVPEPTQEEAEEPQAAPTTTPLPEAALHAEVGPSRFLFRSFTLADAVKVDDAGMVDWVLQDHLPQALESASLAELVDVVRNPEGTNPEIFAKVQEALAEKYGDTFREHLDASINKAVNIVQRIKDARIDDMPGIQTLMQAAGLELGTLNGRLDKTIRDIQLYGHTKNIARAAIKQGDITNLSPFKYHIDTVSEQYMQDIDTAEQAVRSVNLLHMSSLDKARFARDIQLQPQRTSTRMRRFLNLGLELGIAKRELKFKSESELLLKGSEVLLAAYDPEFRAQYNLPEGFEKTLQAILTEEPVVENETSTRRGKEQRVPFTVGGHTMSLSHTDAKTRIAVAYAALAFPDTFIHGAEGNIVSIPLFIGKHLTFNADEAVIK